MAPAGATTPVPRALLPAMLSRLPRTLLFRRPRLLPFTASAAYVAASALHAAGGRGLRVYALGVLAVGLAIAAAFRASRSRAIALLGSSLVVASLAAGAPSGWLASFGVIGALVASVGALLALSEIEGPRALGAVTARSAVPPSILLVAVWAVAFSGYGEYAEHGMSLGEARLRGTLAGVVAAGVVFGWALREGKRRALELGVAERLRIASTVSALVVALATGTALVLQGAPDRFVRLAVAVSSVLVVEIALYADPVKVTRVSRIAMALTSAGGPLVLVAALVATDRPFDGGVVVVLVGVSALLLGTFVGQLAAPLRPAHGAWLDAVLRAEVALRGADPDDALRAVLVALREPAGPTAASPELWTFDPLRVLTVDAAGYARTRDVAIPESESKKALLPAQIVATANEEPQGILRTEVLDALEVRRPDLRPTLHWLTDRGALLAASIVRDGEAEGLLVLPRGPRGDALTLEEARALRGLADQLAGACHVRGAVARGLARERALLARVDEAEERADRLGHAAKVEIARHARATARLARPATVGIYAASSRLAYDAIERRARVSAPIAVVAPSGVDPVPYLARAHLAGARAQAPLVIVDGTAAREHDLERWTDVATSPLALADGGTLVLLDGAALPSDVQRLIGRALAEKRPPWEQASPLDVQIVLTTVMEPEDLVRAMLLDVALGSRIEDALENPVHLPRIRERAEDLRAILTDRLAREGLRVAGQPVGLDDRAYAGLVEYPFPGEDAELASIVQRLVARAVADTPPRFVVRADDVASLALPAFAPEAEEGPEDRRGRMRLV